MSEEEQRVIGDTPIYDISLKINGEKVDWKVDENIIISLNIENKD